MEREKSILKQGAVQHLYGRLAGTLREDAGDAALLVHPFTRPGICTASFVRSHKFLCNLAALVSHPCAASMHRGGNGCEFHQYLRELVQYLRILCNIIEI